MPIYLRSNPRARRNMSVRYDGMDFTDMADLFAYKQAEKGVSGGRTSGRKKTSNAPSEQDIDRLLGGRAGEKRRAEKPPRQRAKGPTLPYLFPDLVDYKLTKLYRLLSKYVGGQRAYCLSYVKQAQATGCRLGNVEAFRAMGVTPDLASAFLDLFRAQTPDPKALTTAQTQQNLDYMTSQPGISCKIAKTNRGSRGRLRRR